MSKIAELKKSLSRGKTLIRYNDISILAVNEKEVIINSGKEQTSKIKNKINAGAELLNLNLKIKQEKFKWYVYFNNRKHTFENGMSLSRVNTRQALKDLCQKHLIGVKVNWDDLFAEDHPHYLDLSVDDMYRVAYSPFGVDKADNKRRLRTTLGKYLSKQHAVDINVNVERQLTDIQHELTKLFPYDVDKEFRILRGQDLVEAYKTGVGLQSCMTGAARTKQVEFYAEFPEKVGLLVWGENQARALLWTGDDGRLFIDRIYAGDSYKAEKKYRDWAANHNAFFVYGMNWKIKPAPLVTLGPKAIRRDIPSLDSFAYCSHFDEENVIVSNQSTKFTPSTMGGLYNEVEAKKLREGIK